MAFKPSHINIDDLKIEAAVINKIGNDPANLICQKKISVTKQGDMVYILRPVGTYTGIFKMKDDGSSLTKICNCNNFCYFLNVIGKWMYYVENADEKLIMKVQLNGHDKKIVFNLTEYTASQNVYFDSMIVIGSRIYFSVNSEDKSIKSFVSSIDLDGNYIKRLYTTDDKNAHDTLSNRVSILGAGSFYLYCGAEGNDSFKLIININNLSCLRFFQCFDYKKMMNLTPDKYTTLNDIRKQFEEKIKYIDFKEGWIYLDPPQHSKDYFIYKMRINGANLQPAYKKPCFKPNIAYGVRLPEYFNGKVYLCFVPDLEHDYTLFKCDTNGTTHNLHGNGSIECTESLQVTGDYAYWNNKDTMRRLNLTSGKEEIIDLKKMNVYTARD